MFLYSTIKETRPDLTDSQAVELSNEIERRYDHLSGMNLSQVVRDVAHEIYGPAGA